MPDLPSGFSEESDEHFFEKNKLFVTNILDACQKLTIGSETKRLNEISESMICRHIVTAPFWDIN